MRHYRLYAHIFDIQILIFVAVAWRYLLLRDNDECVHRDKRVDTSHKETATRPQRVGFIVITASICQIHGVGGTENDLRFILHWLTWRSGRLAVPAHIRTGRAFSGRHGVVDKIKDGAYIYLRRGCFYLVLKSRDRDLQYLKQQINISIYGKRLTSFVKCNRLRGGHLVSLGTIRIGSTNCLINTYNITPPRALSQQGPFL